MAGYEHALYLLLLLGFLFHELKHRHWGYLYLIIGGMALIVIPPVMHVNLPWEIFLGATLPWILWQFGRNWLDIAWRITKKEALVWSITALGMAVIVCVVGKTSWEQAIFFGIVMASLFWKMANGEKTLNILELAGTLTLVLLLVETSLQLAVPKAYLGSLISGAGVGVLLAIIAILASRKATPTHRYWISLGLAYLAYWGAFALNASPIAAVLIAIVVFNEFTNRAEKNNSSILAPAWSTGIIPFLIVLVLFIFVAWQAHQPIGLSQWIEVLLGTAVGLLAAGFGWLIGLRRFERWHLNTRSALISGVYLLGILVLWPRGSRLDPALIWVGIGLAIILPVLSRIWLAAMHQLAEERNDEYPDEL